MTLTAEKESTGAPRRRVPGEPELWLFIFGDLIVFSLFFGVLAWERAANSEAYALGQSSLNGALGMVNTLLLLTSSAAVASGLIAARSERVARARHWYLLGIGLGLGFVAVKAVEYSEHIGGGYLADSGFFNYYFVFTGIHLLHVLIGLVCLYVAASKCRKDTEPPSARLLEGIGVYWHLVDVLWIVLFVLIYLI